MAKKHDDKHKRTRGVLNRLSRIEGHIRSIRIMVEEGRDCSDVLTQISAVRSAIEAAGKVVLEDHLESCLLKTGSSPEDNEVWDGVLEALNIFL